MGHPLTDTSNLKTRKGATHYLGSFRVDIWPSKAK